VTSRSAQSSVLADDELQCGPRQVFLVKIHCATGLTGIGAASIIVPSEIAEFEELDADLGEVFEVADGAVRVPTGAGSA
jgi:hypothetical protein